MTLSNFDWTDKQSLKWFLLLPTGHEGPYSIDLLARRFSQKKISADVSVWAEGLSGPVALKELFMRSEGQELDEDLPPPMPPLPEEDIPPLPEAVDPIYPAERKNKKFPATLVILSLILPVMGFFGWQWLKDQEKFSIRRLPGMSLEVQQRIQASLEFESWDKAIFFKEFVPSDLSRIWLVTSGYQSCKVEALFTSVPEKLLTLTEQQVTFRSKGELSQHLVDLNKFEFIEGSRIVRGLYEMQIKASDCRWDGLLPTFANQFKAADKEYSATTKVVLFEKGAVEFNQLLDQLNAKKAASLLQAQGQEALFWDDLQQKLQTLQAITLQIEQLFIDFSETAPKDFSFRLKPLVSDYTRKFGHFLTNFVVANETYFQELAKGDLRALSQRKNYEELVRLTSKKVGQTSMTVIEDLQKVKKPGPPELKLWRKKVLASFANLKDEINSKIIEVTEDRSTLP